MSRTEQLMSLLTGDEKHSAAATSTLDVIRVLYERVLKVSPEAVGDPHRDRFYLSKGHGPMAYYAVLAEQGFVPEEWLTDWGSYDSPLGFHPDRNLVPGVEIGSGSLGHGLPLAVGTALGLRAQGVRVPAWSCWSATRSSTRAATTRRSSWRPRCRSTRSPSWWSTTAPRRTPSAGRIEQRFATEGWHAVTVDGRDHDVLEKALSHRELGRPNVVVATVEEKY